MSTPSARWCVWTPQPAWAMPMGGVMTARPTPARSVGAVTTGLPPEGERRRSPSGPSTALIDAMTRWRRHGGYFWTVISRSATNGRDWLLM